MQRNILLDWQKGREKKVKFQTDSSGDDGEHTENSNNVPWFVRQWRVPLNRFIDCTQFSYKKIAFLRAIYTSFSYMLFLCFIILYVAETSNTRLVDILTAMWIVSYTCRDMGTGMIRRQEI